MNMLCRRNETWTSAKLVRRSFLFGTRSLSPKLLCPIQYTEIVPVPAINRQKTRAMFFPAFSSSGTLELVQRVCRFQGLRYLSRSGANMVVRCYFDIGIGGKPAGRIEFEVPSKVCFLTVWCWFTRSIVV